MKKTIILKKGLFEKLESFEERINSKHGYEAISISNDKSTVIVLMKRKE